MSLTERNAWVRSGVFSLFAPQAFEIMQRSGVTGDVRIRGTLPSGTHSVEARWNGGAWSTIASGVSGTFDGTLLGLAQGAGVIEARIVGQAEILSAGPVGIGEVFIVAGQSNASGYSASNQAAVGSSVWWFGLFGNDYNWHVLRDPVDGTTGQVDAVSEETAVSGGRGSVWPLFCKSASDHLGLPVGIVPCPLGGTSITQWQPGADHEDRSTLYGSMVHRAKVTGARCVLWWQGENDALAAMDQATYNAYLDTLANAVQADLGIKLMPCKLQNSSGIADANEAAIRAAVAEAELDNPNVLTGPDLSDLASDDQYHLQATAKLQTAADRWEAALVAAFGW